MNNYVLSIRQMTLTSKFKKDIGTLTCCSKQRNNTNLDVKNPKLYKKVKRYYVGTGMKRPFRRRSRC